MYISILNNITLLVSLAVIYSFLNRYAAKNSLSYQLFLGLLFGIVAIVGMMNSVPVTEGIVFDGRSIVLVVAGMFGGPVTAGISGVVSAGYRIYMGGAGTVMVIYPLGTLLIAMLFRSQESL